MLLRTMMVDFETTPRRYNAEEIQKPKQYEKCIETPTSIATTWTYDDVEKWLCDEGFTEYADIIARKHKVTFDLLLSSTDRYVFEN